MTTVRISWIGCLLLVLLVAGAIWLFSIASQARACESVEVTPDTPTGIAGCYRSGVGIASHYGPGNGVAMNFCTWEHRLNYGCGWATITSLQTGITVQAAVVDFCDCYTGTDRERIIDLQYGVVEALGLNWEAGIYDVSVALSDPPAPLPLIPNTAMEAP